jgi:hypothetical protein
LVEFANYGHVAESREYAEASDGRSLAA